MGLEKNIYLVKDSSLNFINHQEKPVKPTGFFVGLIKALAIIAGFTLGLIIIPIILILLIKL